MSNNKPLTFQDRLKFTINYIKNFLFIIVPLTGFIGYVGVLIIKDSDVYKRVNAVVEWYETKSMSFAVGLRVNKVMDEDTKVIKYKVVYKSTDGETYPAVYSKEFGYWFYMDGEGKRVECH